MRQQGDKRTWENGLSGRDAEIAIRAMVADGARTTMVVWTGTRCDDSGSWQVYGRLIVVLADLLDSGLPEHWRLVASERSI